MYHLSTPAGQAQITHLMRAALPVFHTWASLRQLPHNTVATCSDANVPLFLPLKRSCGRFCTTARCAVQAVQCLSPQSPNPHPQRLHIFGHIRCHTACSTGCKHGLRLSPLIDSFDRCARFRLPLSTCRTWCGLTLWLRGQSSTGAMLSGRSQHVSVAVVGLGLLCLSEDGRDQPPGGMLGLSLLDGALVRPGLLSRDPLALTYLWREHTRTTPRSRSHEQLQL